MSIELAISRGHLSEDWRDTLEDLHSRRNQAVYRYARRNWTIREAQDALDVATRFVRTVEDILGSG